MKNLHLFLLSLLLMSVAAAPALAMGGHSKIKVVGEVFGRPVTAEEFADYYKTATLFARPEKSPNSDEEIRWTAWRSLIFRREASRLNITVSRRELQKQLDLMISKEKVKYGSKDYQELIRTRFNESVDVFERRIEDILIISKFVRTKNNPEVLVTEEEMKQEFQDRNSYFESEYIVFENKKEAERFLERVKKKPRFWKDTYDKKKPEGRKGAYYIRMASIKALMGFQKISRDGAYRILGHKEGDFIVAKLRYGDVVLRLLQKREADIGQYTNEKKEYYKNRLTSTRKTKIAGEYFNDLFKRSNHRDYVAEERRAAKIKNLEKESLVTLETNRGTIKLKLFPDTAPKACENFIGLVEKGYYDGLIFHRVIKGFMLQGGDPTGTGTGGESIWGSPFEDEVGGGVTFDRKGLLAMANSGPNTNGSQFFITTKPTPHLNNKHTIFGEVIAGYEVVEQIENTPTDASDKPTEEQKIVKASVEKTH